MSIYGYELEREKWQERREFCEKYKMNDCIKEIDDILNYLESWINSEEKRRSEIVELIDSLEDADQREILTLRYVEDKKVEEIADTLHYSEATIFRKHNQALNALAERFETLP